jgi:hypothetical protein
MPPFSFFMDLFPFSWSIKATTIAGVALWSLALYLGFSPTSEWITDQLNRWFNFAERSLYFSEQDFEETRSVRESINALYASALSIVPFLVVGIGLNYGVEVGLGSSWAISMGILACISCGVYELGRRDGQIGS